MCIGSLCTEILASAEKFCQAVPVGGSGAGLAVWSSRRENSCDSDPGVCRAARLQKNSHIKTQRDSTAENVNHRISVSSAGALGDKQHSIFCMGLTLTLNKTLLTYSSPPLKCREANKEEKCEFTHCNISGYTKLHNIGKGFQKTSIL